MGKIKKFFGAIKAKCLALFGRFKGLSKKKKALVIFALIMLLVISISLVSKATKKPGYSLATAKMGSVSEMVSESGNISSSNRTDIYSPTNGIVTGINVKNGDLVVKDQVLFEVQSTATEQEKKAAEANYLTAVSTLNSAVANRDSLQASMFSAWQTFKDTAESAQYQNSDKSPRNDERAQPEFHIAESNWTAAEKNYQNAQTAIAQAQANVASTKLLLDATKDAKVKATADGVVENVSVAQDSAVKINQVLTPVKPVLTLLSSGTTEVAIDLSESDVVKVEPGQEAKLDVTAVNNKKYKGQVVRVDSVGTDENGVIRYTCYIKILDPDESLREGMSVDADVMTKKLDSVLVVPNSAVKPYQGGRAVRVVGKNGQIEYVPVKIGIRGTEYTQILGGISEGQKVITALSNESIKRPGLF